MKGWKGGNKNRKGRLTAPNQTRQAKKAKQGQPSARRDGGKQQQQPSPLLAAPAARPVAGAPKKRRREAAQAAAAKLATAAGGSVRAAAPKISEGDTRTFIKVAYYNMGAPPPDEWQQRTDGVITQLEEQTGSYYDTIHDVLIRVWAGLERGVDIDVSPRLCGAGGQNVKISGQNVKVQN